MEQKDFQIALPPSVDEYNLKTTLEAAQVELIKLLRERESTEWRINKLQNDIVHLAALCHVEVEDPIVQLGLTDAVRWIFARDKKPLGVVQIVEALKNSDPSVSEYKNLPANIHTIVRRLVKANEVKPWVEPPPERQPIQLRGIGGLGEPPMDRYIWAGGLPVMPPRPRWLKKRIRNS